MNSDHGIQCTEVKSSTDVHKVNIMSQTHIIIKYVHFQQGGINEEWQENKQQGSGETSKQRYPQPRDPVRSVFNQTPCILYGIASLKIIP